jgi:5-methyltetrahydropteroyltriglutamate--homocysteine methyltransferase
MSTKITYTVVGSHPVDVDRQQIMTQYYQNTPHDWTPYILQAVDDMVDAGITMVSDGQTRDPFTALCSRHITGMRIRARPEVIDTISYDHPITVPDLTLVRKHLPSSIHLLGLLPGPYTLAQSCVDLFYHDEQHLAYDFAAILHKEAQHLTSLVDMISVDEPCFSMGMPDYAQDLLSQVFDTITCPRRLHVCGNVSSIVPHLLDLPVDILSHEFKATPSLLDVFAEYPCSKNICLGSVRSDHPHVENLDEVTAHITHAQDIFGDHITQLAPDCGLRYLPREIAQAKLNVLVKAGEHLYG